MRYLHIIVILLSLASVGLILLLPKASLNTALVYQGF